MEFPLDLIYCAGGNEKLARIAHEEGWLLGVRSDRWHHPYPLTLIDINYKNPKFEKHLTRVAKERPKYATVTDLSDQSLDPYDIERAVTQAERLKDYCQFPLIIPKLAGQLDLIPKEWAIGYSVPTTYGGASFLLWEIIGRKVHLLGGSPHRQIELGFFFNVAGQMLSADGNMAQKMAVGFLKYWDNAVWVRWPTSNRDEYYECFRLSCRNIREAWQAACYKLGTPLI
jgi:hypothetical protein